MSDHRPIDPAPYLDYVGRHANPIRGAAPMLQWLRIADLVVDPAYQRDILRTGARNIGKIARDFDWSKFAPVIVAPVPGGRYAIVDGQHRTTAAAARGIEEVPCQIIVADAANQAAAFAAINGAVTAMTPLQIHAAKVEAGDPAAVALADACRAGGVTICRYAVPAMNMKIGETLAVGALSKLLSLYGGDLLSQALRCITKVGNGNAGLVKATIVMAICDALDEAEEWRAREADLLALFGRIDLGGSLEKAAAKAKAAKVPHHKALAVMLKSTLAAAAAKAA